MSEFFIDVIRREKPVKFEGVEKGSILAVHREYRERAKPNETVQPETMWVLTAQGTVRCGQESESGELRIDFPEGDVRDFQRAVVFVQREAHFRKQSLYSGETEVASQVGKFRFGFFLKSGSESVAPFIKITEAEKWIEVRLKDAGDLETLKQVFYSR